MNHALVSRSPNGMQVGMLRTLTGLFLATTFVACMTFFLAGAAQAASFQLKDGSIIKGEVVHATRNTLMVRQSNGGVRQLARGDVVEVEITGESGEMISGALKGWKNGVYDIDAATREAALSEETVTEEATTEETVTEETVIEEALPDEVLAEESGSEETGSDDGTMAEGDEGPPILSISEAKAAEGDSAITFDLALSRPANRPILVIFATLDRTAKAGEDFELERGSITFEPGEVSAFVKVPLINDAILEDDEYFEVFVATDQNVAVIRSKRAVGTILNDDEGPADGEAVSITAPE